jgi:PhzF family phenazine biosynthesis protein
MKLKVYYVDAFTDRLFSGNPAAVCPLNGWLPDETMQNIAMENNLAETAFFVKENGKFSIRWFTPSVEVDLCGHATLASALVLFNYENHSGDEVVFNSPRSGILTVKRDGDQLTLDFPTDKYEWANLSPELIACFNSQPQEAYRGKTDYMLVFNSEEEITRIVPDLNAIARLKVRGVIVTAPGTESDFVSRFFAPQSGVNEDPATGSAHTTLTPYWANRLAKNDLTAIQLSSRRGQFKCYYNGERVMISGQGRTYMKGEIELDSQLKV